MFIDKILRIFGTSVPAQLEKPEGLVGRFLISGWLEKGNARLNEFCISAMELQGTDRVLEIGFGPGGTLGTMAQTAEFVAGVDFAPDMCRSAERKNRAFIAAGRVEVRCAGVDELPYPDASFDKIYTANTIYFWPHPERNAREILRVLKPGGGLYIGYRPRSAMQKIPVIDQRFTMYEHQDIAQLFMDAGAGEVRTISREEDGLFDSHCAVVRK